MNGVIALLDDKHTILVQDLWKILEDECGFSEGLITPFPHFSWQIAEEYDFNGLGKKLVELTSQLPPFTIRTAGIGVFTGKSPVVFIPIVKDPDLLELHQTIWDQISSLGKGMSDHYAPENWIPHITLASRDIAPDSLIKMIKYLGPLKIEWEIGIDRFALGCQSPQGVSKINETYTLSGK